GADHFQQAFWISGQLSRCGIDEHLVPSLLVLVPCKYHRFAIRLGEEVCVDMQGKSGQLFGGQECVEQALRQRFRINSQSYAYLGASMKCLQPWVRRVKTLNGILCVSAKDVPVLNLAAGPEADDEVGAVAPV